MDRIVARFLVVAAGTVLSGCGEIVHPVVRTDLSDKLLLHAILYERPATQYVFVKAANVYKDVTVARVTISKEIPDSPMQWVELGFSDECHQWQGLVGTYGLYTTQEDCAVAISAELEAGARHKVEVTAPGYASAWGVTRVVGRFSVRNAELDQSGRPARLAADWSASSSAYRYLLGLSDRCLGCTEAWWVAVGGTNYDGPVPDEAIQHGPSGLAISVTAVNKNLYDWLTTSHRGYGFGFPPVQNVIGGYGMVGSMIRQVYPVK